MKPAEKRSLRNRAERGETRRCAVQVKAECEPGEVHTNGDGLGIQIKEEPLPREIGERHDGDSSSCSDAKPDTATPGSGVRVKDEWDSEPRPRCELGEAAVKEESEPWIKEEGGREEEAGDAGNIQEDGGEGEQVCTGRSQWFGVVWVQ